MKSLVKHAGLPALFVFAFAATGAQLAAWVYCLLLPVVSQ